MNGLLIYHKVHISNASSRLAVFPINVLRAGFAQNHTQRVSACFPPVLFLPPSSTFPPYPRVASSLSTTPLSSPALLSLPCLPPALLLPSTPGLPAMKAIVITSRSNQTFCFLQDEGVDARLSHYENSIVTTC